MPVELPIAFPAHRMADVLAGRVDVTRRLVTHRTGRVLDAWLAPDGWRAKVSGSVASVRLRCPYVSEGRGNLRRPQYLWVKEALRRDVRKHADVMAYAHDNRAVLVCASCGKAPNDLDMHASCGQPLARIEHPWTWTDDEQPATWCPRWASRVLLSCSAHSVERVGAGVAVDSSAPAPVGALVWTLSSLAKVAP